MQDESSLGQKLTEAHADIGKIIVRTLPRILLVGIVVLAGVRSNPPKGMTDNIFKILLVMLMILAVAVWMLFPLLHCRDYVVFYENGMDFCGKAWTVEEMGDISFMDAKGGVSLFARTYLCTDVKDFNITYIKEVKKNFNRAYFETLSLR